MIGIVPDPHLTRPNWMMKSIPRIAVLSCLLIMLCVCLAEGSEKFASVEEMIIAGEHGALRELIRDSEDANLMLPDKTSILMVAALRGDRESMEVLLKGGADVNHRNDAGASALIWCAYDVEKVRLLLKYKADINQASNRGNTPLSTAAAHPRGAESVKLLINEGAHIDTRNRKGNSPLGMAVFSGHHQSVVALVEAGAEVNDRFGRGNANTLLTTAAERQEYQTVEYLLQRGANPNVQHQFLGSALNTALLSGKQPVAELLLEQGADISIRSRVGNVPPLMFASHFESEDTSIAGKLLDMGANPNAKNIYGETALTWAAQRNHHSLINLLKQSGATRTPGRGKVKMLPDKRVNLTVENREALLGGSVTKSLSLLQNSSDIFLKNRGSCVSCHHQYIPAIAFGWARDKGFPLNEASIDRLITYQVKEWGTRAESAYQLENPFFVNARLFGWGLYGFAALDYPADAITDAISYYLTQTQRPDGRWVAGILRPPLGGNDIMGTALVIHAIKAYPPRGHIHPHDSSHAIRRARSWLLAQIPETHQESIFRMLGLFWAGEDMAIFKKELRLLLATANPDGGWSQLPGLPSDAWATGLALVTLGSLQPDLIQHSVYTQGLEFLLRTQFDDGSWYVARRTWPMQQHFDSQFPHGKDQWISASGTAVASMAMILAMDKAPESLPTTPDPEYPMLTRWKQSMDGKSMNVNFQNDIEPILERSCLECHSGEDPEARLNLESLNRMKRGGESGISTIVPGRPDLSPLFLFPAGIIEDMEMPPIHKRDDFPALTKSEQSQLWFWIKNLPASD